MNRGSQDARIASNTRLPASMRPRFMNRGSAAASRTSAVSQLASMRPRFMNRGSDLSHSARGRSTPRFNEAPIHESGKLFWYAIVDFTFGASMRPRFMNRGSCAVLILSHPPKTASMRPRFMNRGSESRVEWCSRTRAASMRPRFMNRGSSPTSEMTRFPSRRFNEAPIHESGKYSDTAATGAHTMSLQ